MNRRGFLGALIGFAAAPAIAKVADAFAGPDFTGTALAWEEDAAGELTVIDLRAAARVALASWFDRETNRMMFRAISAGDFYIDVAEEKK